MVNTAVEMQNDGILKVVVVFLVCFMAIRSVDAAPFVVEKGWWGEGSINATCRAFRRGGVKSVCQDNAESLMASKLDGPRRGHRHGLDEGVVHS